MKIRHVFGFTFSWRAAPPVIVQLSDTDAELARVSVLILDVTKTAYVSPVAKRLASVMKNFNKKIDRKNLNFVNKTAI